MDSILPPLPDAYDDLVAMGTLGSFKRDLLVDASGGIRYLADIRKWFAERNADAAQAATLCTVRLVRELVGGGWCSLATWAADKRSSVAVAPSDQELAAIVDRYEDMDPAPQDYFLVSTDAGNQWAARYLALVAEL